MGDGEWIMGFEPFTLHSSPFTAAIYSLS